MGARPTVATLQVGPPGSRQADNSPKAIALNLSRRMTQANESRATELALGDWAWD
jgi:hypothetical protein